MDLSAALPQRILPALVRPGDEAVERDRHVAGGVRHRRPPSDCDLQASAPYRTGTTAPRTSGPASEIQRVEENRQSQVLLLHAPARSRTWIYRLGGGRLIHWTTRARTRRSVASGRTARHREGYRRCARRQLSLARR